MRTLYIVLVGKPPPAFFTPACVAVVFPTFSYFPLHILLVQTALGGVWFCSSWLCSWLCRFRINPSTVSAPRHHIVVSIRVSEAGHGPAPV